MTIIKSNPYTTNEWLNMLREAQTRIGVNTDQDLERFLVNLFEKTLQEPNYPNAELEDAFFFLSKKKTFSNQEISTLADKCLIQIGLYPNKISSSALTPDIVIHSGKKLYNHLSNQPSNDEIPYEKISEHFITLMDVLLSFREDIFTNEPLSPEIIFYLWEHSESQYAKKRLIR